MLNRTRYVGWGMAVSWIVVCLGGGCYRRRQVCYDRCLDAYTECVTAARDAQQLRLCDDRLRTCHRACR